MMKKSIIIILVCCLCVTSIASAGIVDDILGLFGFDSNASGSKIEEVEIPTRIIYQGSTAIRDTISSKANDGANAELSTATSTALKDVKYPYDISASKTEDTKTVITTLKIQKFRCDKGMQICGYWIEATRDGKEVQTNSPIWISPPPYEVVVSEAYDSVAKENVVTIKEDPKVAVEQILQGYVDRQPLGKATVGTKE